MKIAWICGNTNSDLQKLFPGNPIPNQAPWIDALISGMREQKDVELHVISPNFYQNRNLSISINGVSFHLFKRYILLPKRLFSALRINIWTHYMLSRNYIKRLILDIQPDVIHLFGTENPSYAAGIVPLLVRYPVLATIQGFRTKVPGNSAYNRYSIKLEEFLLRSIRHFGVRTTSMQDHILRYNPSAQMHWHLLPYPAPQPTQDVTNRASDKKWDIVFCARVCKDKGIEDLLRVLKIVKEARPGIKLLICGHADPYYARKLHQLIEIYNLNNNIEFTGWINKREDMFKLMLQSRLYVLPTHYDNLPGSVLESMYLGIPVITNNVDGMDILNADRESVVLVEKGNDNMLSSCILDLLTNDYKAEQLANNARITAMPYFDNGSNVRIVISIYNELIECWKPEKT